METRCPSLRTRQGHVAMSLSRAGFVALMTVLFQVGSVWAQDAVTGGFRIIAKVLPSTDVSSISGLAFDNEANPWVIDRQSWRMQRIDKNTGDILQTFIPDGTATYCDSLAWSAARGIFYTANQTSLFFIKPDANERKLVGTSMQYFNWFDLSVDPFGKLWLAADRNGGELWSVNTSTSVATFERSITGLTGNQQLHALTIDSAGRIFIASSYSGANNIYQVDPLTGVATLAMNWTDTYLAMATDIEIDPHTGKWYALREDRGESPRGYYVVELTGIPEPASLALLGAIVSGLALRRSRGSAIAFRSDRPA